MSYIYASRGGERSALLATIGFFAIASTAIACGSANDDDAGALGPSSSADGGAARVAAPPPVPQLSFTFEEKTARLHARVKRDTARDAVVYARVRRAAPGPSAEVDCERLRATEKPISLRDAALVARALDAVGPRVDATLLPSIYTLLSSAMPPSRSIVEGCLVGANGVAIARVSMSLMKAWDLAAPVTTVGAPTRLHGVEAYGEACEAELGELTPFRGGTLDCVADPAMQIVPITVSDPASPDNVLVTLDGSTTTWPLRGAQAAAARRCDRPAWLDYHSDAASQCSPFSRVGAFVNSRGTRVVVVCRRYEARSRNDAAFDDVNMIAHNPETGRACFFNSRLEAPPDGRKIPSPSSVGADAYWMDVRDVTIVGCTNCHDADPWVHSPWIDQVRGRDGRAIVPKIGEDSAYSIATKYSVFARESFVTATRDGRAATWPQPTHLADAGKCGSCHRIGSVAGLADWTARAVGHPSSADWLNAWVSDAYRTPAKLHWMSPGAPIDAPDDARSVKTILACGRGASGCVLKETPH